MVAPKDSIPNADAETIRTTVDFLQRNGYSSRLAPLLGIPVDSVAKWEVVNNQLSVLGVEPAYPTDTYCSVYFDNTKLELDIKGYNLLYKVYAYEKTKHENDFSGLEITAEGTSLQYFKDGEALDSFDLKPYCQLLEANGACNYSAKPDSLRVFEASSSGFDLKFYVDNMSFNKEGGKVRELSGLALLRKKQ
jgi:hypothetical protein